MNPDRTEPASGYSPARDGRQIPAQNPPGGILLPFPPGCVQGTLLRRVKRFSLDFRLRGSLHRAHTNNSGAMLGLVREGLSVWLSPASGPGRKSAYTLEMIRLPAFPEDFWVGVNTLTPNRLLRAAFAARLLPWASGYTVFRPEARRGSSRLDALLTGPDLPPLWVECKNVTLVEDDMAAFPDAVSLRGRKHLEEMTAIAASGERAAFFYCVQRPDGRCFGPADYVDAAYAGLYFQALEAGVEVYPHRALLSPRGIGLGALLPLAGPPELST